MRSIQLVLGLHAYQPSGNLPQVFEEAFTRAYVPVVSVLERHAGVKFALRFSGAILEWLQARHPEFLLRVRALVDRGQVELIGGAMFEPVLPAIPRADQVGQIRYAADVHQELFGVRPTGAWLAERVWEPSLPTVLAEAGVQYTLLDDTLFMAGGVTPEELLHSFRTEDQGKCVTVLPISRRLRQMIPFRPVQEVIDYLHLSASDSGERVAVMVDDAERFGAWPGTEAVAAQDGWLDRFFTAVEAEKDWLRTTTPNEYITSTPTRRLVYLPGGSYPEMGLWSLPAPYARDFEAVRSELERAGLMDRATPLLRGGGWRNFLSRYPEVGQMHKRAVYVSNKVHSTARAGEAANLALWRAQTCAPYWQGMGGGFALNFLRSAVYRNLILSENAIEPRKYSWLDIEYNDLDMDGAPEVIAESNTLNIHFNAAHGGMITELDFRPLAFNLTDTFSRRPEVYHPTTDATIGRHGARRPGGTPRNGRADLIYDAYERRSLIDHFIGAESTLDEFVEGRYLELGDFTTGAFEASKYRNRVTLTRQGSVRGPVGEPVPVEVKKAIRIIPKEARLEVEYRITNHGIVDIITRFGSEWGFGMLAGNAPDRYYTIEGRPAGHLSTVAEDRAVTRAGLTDEWLGLNLEFDFEGREVLLWRHPVETISQVGGGTLAKLYQSSVMLPLWDLDLPVGRSRRVAYTLKIKQL